MLLAPRGANCSSVHPGRALALWRQVCKASGTCPLWERSAWVKGGEETSLLCDGCAGLP